MPPPVVAAACVPRARRLGRCCWPVLEVVLLALSDYVRAYHACLQSQGSLKISPSGLVWKRSGGGRTVEVPADGARCGLPGPAHQGGAQPLMGLECCRIWALFKPPASRLCDRLAACASACLLLPLNRRANRPHCATPGSTSALVVMSLL